MTVRLARIAVLALALCVGSAEAGPPAHILLRAVSSKMSPELIKYVARNAEPRKVSWAPGKTPHQVLTKLCGNYFRSYFGEFRRLNRGFVGNLDTPLGADAIQLEWPACPYIELLPRGFSVNALALQVEAQSADTKVVAYRALTGGGGTPGPVKQFFAPTGSGELKLNRGYVTVPVDLTLKNGVTPDAFGKGMTSKALSGAQAQGAKIETGAAVARTHPVTDLSNGKIIAQPDVGALADGAIQRVSTDECTAEDAKPLPFHAIQEAYSFAIKRLAESNRQPRTVVVTVVDNGFFGANPEAPKEFGDVFPEAYFQNAPDLGFQVDGVWPINYENKVPNTDRKFVAGDITLDSGHGTHVAGLIIGGPSLRNGNARSIFQNGIGQWLHINFLNFGNGQNTLVPNAWLTLGSEVPEAQGVSPSGIVNMSIAYNGDATPGIQLIFRNLFGGLRPVLFVVAAGNDYDPDLAHHWYPAAMGGLAVPNVISVAAHDNSDRLTAFSNRGDAVDIAAPGCGVRSWVDDTGREEKMSGTSQAAPQVTFAAALVKSIQGAAAAPADVKNRLIASGDLLAGDDSVTIASQSELNIPKSLYIFDDYIRVTTTDGKVMRLLGKVTSIRGLKCPSDALDKDRALIRSFRQTDAKGILFWVDDSNTMHKCDWRAPAADSGAQLHFEPRANVAQDGTITDCRDPANAAKSECAIAPDDYKLSSVQELVLQDPLAAQ